MAYLVDHMEETLIVLTDIPNNVEVLYIKEMFISSHVICFAGGWPHIDAEWLFENSYYLNWDRSGGFKVGLFFLD